MGAEQGADGGRGRLDATRRAGTAVMSTEHKHARGGQVQTVPSGQGSTPTGRRQQPNKRPQPLNLIHSPGRIHGWSCGWRRSAGGRRPAGQTKGHWCHPGYHLPTKVRQGPHGRQLYTAATVQPQHGWAHAWEQIEARSSSLERCRQGDLAGLKARAQQPNNRPETVAGTEASAASQARTLRISKCFVYL